MHKITMAVLLLAASTAAAADERLSLGLGVGASYSGLGANLALRGDGNLKYVSLGCVDVRHSGHDGTDVACGPGIGWWQAGLLGAASDRHALGLYLGPVDSDGDATRLEPVYGIGAGYAYFLDGIGARGFSLGVMPTLSRKNGDVDAGAMLQAGYQF